MDLTLRFVELVNGPTTNVDLGVGWSVLSAHARPSFDVDEQCSRINELAARCRAPTLDAVRELLFDDLGYSGATSDYYAPENSLLDTVLDRRQGLPISLATLLIEVGRLNDVPLQGVGMPGHFLVRHRDDRDLFIDPFDRGRLLDMQDCRQLFERVTGGELPFDERFLAGVPATAVLSRMAANLVNAYRQADRRGDLRWAARVRARCPGVLPTEHVQLAGALARTGAFDEAADLLDDAATRLGGEDAAAARRQALLHRARLN